MRAGARLSDADKEKETSDKEKDDVSDKGKELEKEISDKTEGDSESLSTEEWVARHRSEAVRLINPGPRDELL